jgi:hypothetical protein
MNRKTMVALAMPIGDTSTADGERLIAASRLCFPAGR